MKIEINKKIIINLWTLLFLTLLSCTKNMESKIFVEKVYPISAETKRKLSLPPYIDTIILISSDEDLILKSEKMSFAFVAVENISDFQLPDDKREEAMSIFEIVTLEKVSKKEFNIYIDGGKLKGKTLFCRLERPGFVGQEGYKSAIFKLEY